VKKWLKRIGIAFGILVLLAIGFALWVEYTTSGARFALARAQGALGGKLVIADVQGTFAGPLQLSGVRYRDPAAGVDAQVGTVRVQFAISELFGRVLHFENVDIDNVDVALTTVPPPPNPPGRSPSASEAMDGRERPPPPTPLQDLLKPPLTITLDRVRLAHTKISLDKTPLFALDSLDLSANWTNTGISVRQFALRTPEGHVDLNGALTSYSDYRGQAKADVDWKVAQYQVTGTLDFANDGRQSTFTVKLRQPTPATATGTLVPTAPALPWTLNFEAPSFDPAPLLKSETLKSLALNLRASGDRASGNVTGSVDANAHRVMIDPLRFALANQVLTIDTLRLRSPEAAGTLNAHGKVLLDAKPVGGDVVLNWEGVELPADIVGQALATQGSLDANGNAERFAAKGDLSIGPPGKPAHIALDLAGTPEKIALHQLELKQPKGSLTATGDIELQPQVGWKLDAKADNFDPGAFAAQWPGSLSFALSTNGSVEKAGPRGALKLDRLGGTLRQRALSGNGEITFTPPLSVDGKLDLASGNSHVAVRGKGGHQTDATVELAIASLGDWLPQAAGAVRGNIAAKGEWPRLAVDGDVHGSKLAVADTHADALDVTIHATGVASAPGGKVNIKATHLTSGSYTFDTATVDADGDEGKHSIRIDARGSPLSASATLDGTLAKKGNAAPNWRGTLSALTLQVKDRPSWKQADAAQVSYADGAFSLGELCLKSDTPSVCLSAASRSDGSLQAKYTLQHLPLALVTKLAAPDAPLKAQGEIDGSGEIARSAAGVLNGHASLNSPTGSIAYPDEATQPLVAYHAFTVDATLASQQSTINLNADLDDGGKLEGHVTLGANGPNGMPLGGTVGLHLNSLRFVDLLTTSLTATQGRVEGQFTLAGTTSNPGASGQLAVHGFATEVPEAGIKLGDGEVSVHSSDGKTFSVDGAVSSGGGKLALTGNFGIGSNAPLALKLNGDNFLAADIPGAQVHISPALTLQRDEKRFSVTGEVTIPKANVDLTKLPGGGAAKVSSDVVVTDAKQAPAATSLPLDAVVTVKLGTGEKASTDLRQGREVHLVGFGLDGYLGGGLTVEEHPGRATVARGQIDVNGTYRAYGQDLTIERGRLLFASTPIENPGLDIRATRSFPEQNVVAGLQVRGTALRPELTVFSDPAMEQSDALSYLVAGKPMSQLKSGEGDAVGSAARALGTAGGDLLARNIGAKMGVDDVGVSDSSAIGGSALSVGKYLSPRLYMSYGVGLFTPGQVVTVRYRLTPHFDAEIQNGTLSSRAGVNYKIEK
jgi:translocation and assembly module TamB